MYVHMYIQITHICKVWKSKEMENLLNTLPTIWTFHSTCDYNISDSGYLNNLSGMVAKFCSDNSQQPYVL